jgi:serine protease Do
VAKLSASTPPFSAKPEAISAETLGLEKSRGALVANVSQGSPADQAGMKVGDVILEYNGTRIDDAHQLPILVARTGVGTTAKATVWRDKKQIPLNVKIGELKEEEAVASGPQKGKLGITVQDVTPDIAESLGLDRSEGIVITAVEPQSPADDAGLRRGDVIVEVNRKKIANAGEFRNIINQTKPGENLLFLIRRGGSTLFLALKSPPQQG